MTGKKDPYASESETQALLVPDARTEAERKLAQMMTERGADEQGAEAYLILRQIALDLPADQPAQQEPVAWLCTDYDGKAGIGFTKDAAKRDAGEWCNDFIALYTSPPAQRKPLHIGEETAAFKAWFDAWWIGDGDQGETIPTQSDKHFLTYLDQYTLGFGAWMAAKHAAHGIKEQP